MADSSYQPKVYRRQGGDEQVVASGGTLTIESGGVIAVAEVGGLKIGGANVGVATIADVTATAAEINKLAGVTGGVAAASKAVVLGSASEISGIRRKVNLAAATQALDASHSGQKFVGAEDAVFTLPAAAAGTKGVWYEFETGALSTGVGLSISPAAADHIRGNGLTSTDNKDLINSGASDRLGDMVKIYCDGVDGWVIEAIIGTWAKE